ncbi:TrlF family AAA-like ATPase [Pasteurella oralis]|uniref:TrlF family AAA-like ATPase n=1 Tax=Pasteurella oralis TaxID=1071947 RepID=A0ABW4NSN1_9PAST|nr:ATPase [Pasteurella oralis]
MLRGSEWGRWDLHVHTKNTAKNDQFESKDMNEYCEILFRKAIEKDIKVIGITDYLNIDNYKKVLNFKENIYINNKFTDDEKDKVSDIFIIPNIELRLDKIARKSLINIHILFNPAFIEEVENSLLTKIEFPISTDSSASLNRHGLIKLGKHRNSRLNDEEAYLEGIKHFCVDYNRLIKIINENKLLKENCLVFVANGDNDGVSGLKTHEELLGSTSSNSELRDSIYRQADGIFSSKISDRNYFLGNGKDSSEKIIDRLGFLKPCIHGSDAHTENKLFEPDQQRYCWIKADPTFEGLKQILYEPESRVHIGATVPEFKNDYEVIDHIKLDNLADNDVANEYIYFNQNLTTIIGGRSSGKSTLLQCLAKKLNKPLAGNEESENKLSHIEKLSSNLQIIWKDGKEDNSRRVEYFYQGHMYQKSTNKGIEDIIKDILLQQKTDIFDKYDEAIGNIKISNTANLTEYSNAQEKIKVLNQSLEKLGNYNDVLSQIANLNEKINQLNLSELNEQDLEYYNNKNKVFLENHEKFDKITSILNKLDTLRIADIFSFQIKPGIPSYIDIPWNLSHDLCDIPKYIESKINESQKEYRNKLVDEIDRLSILNSEIENDALFNRVKSLLEKSLQATPILNQLEQEKTKKIAIEEINTEIKSLERLADEKYNNIENNWRLMFDELDNLIDSINQMPFNEEQLIIKSSQEFQVISFKGFIEGFIDQRSGLAQRLVSEIPLIKNKMELYQFFNEIRDGLTNRSIKLRNNLSLQEFITKFFSDSWFKLKYDVIYDEDSYNNMSQGKKAFVVLKLNLECSDSKCPIIIDQPEDDLDNRAIYSELVSYLKAKKSERQIILVTHNPNVVINADSELVIVANQHGSKSFNTNGKKFEYISGSIESIKAEKESTLTLAKKSIREHICEILEGGEQAFKLRERKYSF